MKTLKVKNSIDISNLKLALGGRRTGKTYYWSILDELQQENKALKEHISITEQENKEFEKKYTIADVALRMACETIKEIMPNRPMYICGSAIAERLGISQTSEIKDYAYFIEQAKEYIK